MSLLKRLLLLHGGGAGGVPAPIFPLEYIFGQGAGAPYNIYYDDALGSGAYLLGTTESIPSGMSSTGQNKIVRKSDGTLIIVYCKQLAGKYQVYVIYSSDEGATWGSEVRVSTKTGMNGENQTEPSIAVDSNDNLNVVWMGEATGYAATCIWSITHNGTSWSAIGNPLDTGVAGMEAYSNGAPNIAVDSNDDWHVVFKGRATGLTRAGVWYTKYVTSWSVPVRINIATDAQLYHTGYCYSIAIDSNDKVHVVYSGNDSVHSNVSFQQIYRSTDATGAWVADWVSENMSNYYNGAPDIAIDASDDLHVCWTTTSLNRVYYNKFSGGSWASPSTEIDDFNQATIAIDSDGYINILYKKGDDSLWIAQYITSWILVQVQPDVLYTWCIPNLRWYNYPK